MALQVLNESEQQFEKASEQVMSVYTTYTSTELPHFCYACTLFPACNQAIDIV